MGLGFQEICDMNQTDHHLYAVVHTAKKYLSYDEFQKDFLCHFVLGDVTCCMYIIKVEDIAGPLFVFNNYGGAVSVANILQCTLLQSKWGQYYSDQSLFEVFSNVAIKIIRRVTPIFYVLVVWIIAYYLL
jgi:hypothetical protein